MGKGRRGRKKSDGNLSKASNRKRTDSKGDQHIVIGATRVRKCFGSEGSLTIYYEGIVDSFDGQTYHVTYEDGDDEDRLTKEEVMQCMLMPTTNQEKKTDEEHTTSGRKLESNDLTAPTSSPPAEKPKMALLPGGERGRLDADWLKQESSVGSVQQKPNGAEAVEREPSKEVSAQHTPLRSSTPVGSDPSPSPSLMLRKVLSGKHDQVEIFFDPELCLSIKPAQKKDMGWLSSHLYTPALILKVEEEGNGQFFVVKTQENEIHKFPVEGVKEVVAQDKEGQPDILQLNDFSQESLLHTLRVRYEKNHVYTFVGPILISINPYKWNPTLYSEDRMMEYHGAQYSKMGPHLFVVADRAYSALAGSGGTPQVENQSIIISGESGAGKTEATKIIMQYLARITMHCKSQGDSVGRLEDQVLSANPLLESFGNACTLKNDNSSRFGKYILIQFDSSARIVGAKVQNYLLEKTRIVCQMEGERNYHIFYQLFRGADAATREQLQLGDGLESFNYLNKSHHNVIEGRSDKEEFEVTCNCLEKLNIGHEKRMQIFALLSVVLHLGNLEFEVNENGDCSISAPSEQHMQVCCQLLEVSPEALTKALCTKQLTIRNELTIQQQTVEQATDKRDALAKALYSALFVWLVDCLNRTIAHPSDQTWGFIGVLDIYGFEIFELNSFEQLLINYANEKLQRHFNRHIFEVEQEEYATEGIDWSYVEFNDNQACLDLIEGKPNNKPGILAGLDDTHAFGNTGVEQKYLASLHANFGKRNPHPHYVVPRFNKDTHFGVAHYAGEVQYAVEGFHDKNTENLSPDVKDVLRGSQSELIGEVCHKMLSEMPEPSPKPSGRKMVRSQSQQRKLRASSVGSQFKVSLGDLIDTVSETMPHFIRCIKPNQLKQPDALDAVEVMRQLKYAGMMETIRIRQQGYALREDHKTFFEKYQALDPRAKNIKELVGSISDSLNVSAASWQLGHSKVFMRKDLSLALERLVAVRLRLSCSAIQRFWRLYRGRLAVIKLQALWRGKRVQHAFGKKKMACVVLQCFSRSRVQRIQYMVKRSSAILLQSHIRRLNAKRYVLKVRDPYLQMSTEELRERETAVQTELNQALLSKDFTKCQSLQVELDKIQQHLGSSAHAKPEPQQSNTSREETELQLLATELEMEAALTAKNFGHCQELQAQLDKLREQMKEFPTHEGLSTSLKHAEAKLEEALSAKNFRECEVINAEIETLKKSLEAVEPDEDAFAGTYEEEKSNLQTKMDTAMQQKRFDLCTEIQTEMDILEKKFNEYADIDGAIQKLQDDIKKAQIDGDFMLQAKLIIDERTTEKARSWLPTTNCDENAGNLEETAPVCENEDLSSMQNPIPSPIATEGDKEKIESNKNENEEANIQPISIKVKGPTAKKAVDPQSEDSRSVKVKPISRRGSTSSSIKIKHQADADPESEDSRSIKVKPILRRGSTASSIKVKHEGSARSVPNLDDSGPARPSSPVPLKIKTSSSQLLQQKPSSVAQSTSSASGQKAGRTVRQLRPVKVPMLRSNLTVAEVTKRMSASRTDAALLIRADKTLEGIVTAKDITRRLVSKGLSFDTTVKKIMTPNPICVDLDDSAIESLSMMVENHFQHLPVLNEKGFPVGAIGVSKCLYDALRRLEKMEKKSDEASDVTAVVEKAMAGMKAGDSKRKAQMLKDFLRKMSKDAPVTTLGAILETKKHRITTKPDQTIEGAAVQMTRINSAILVVKAGELQGILTFKDILNRVVAKGLDPSTATVSEIMTADPESFPPDLDLVEAMHLIHENRFLHLPIVSKHGDVMGMVDVMDVVEATVGNDAGSEGWGTLINTGFGKDDDMSDTSSYTGSVHTVRTNTNLSARPSVNEGSHVAPKPPSGDRPVKRLRPKVPVLAQSSQNILQVAKTMASKRMDSALLLSGNSLAGIFTANDVVKTLSKGTNLSGTSVSAAMTKNPRYVSMEDSALDSLALMVENGFRHLPVINDEGDLAGILDIAKCLYDAITRMEMVREKKGSEKNRTDSAAKLLSSSMKNMRNKKSVQDILQMIDSVFAGSNPTLEEILAKKPTAKFARPTDTIRQATKIMAKSKAALLVVEDDILKGILTPKDILNRVVAKELNPDTTLVEVVMTRKPDTFSPEMELIDALHQMHDHKYLHLPVVSERTKEVLGHVELQDILSATMGEDGGKEGWRTLFGASLDVDDKSDIASLHSAASYGSRLTKRSQQKKPQVADSRPVSKLRPKMSVLAPAQTSITQVSKMMASRRTDSALLTDDGSLAGILTDNDILRRVVTKRLDPSSVEAASAMTSNPRCVNKDDSALEALSIMVEHRFRHLPVVGDDGSVVGVLDIAKCLYDAISKMERIQRCTENSSQESFKKIANAVSMSKNKNTEAVKSMLTAAMQSMFGDSVPTLQDVIDKKKKAVLVDPDATVLEAAEKMSAAKSAVLVVEHGSLAGIITPKDVLNRVVSKELDAESIETAAIMTRNPDRFPPEMDLVDAMHQMHDHKYLHLPVVTESGKVVGIVDVMDVVAETMGDSKDGGGWNSFFGTAMDFEGDGLSDTSSKRSVGSKRSRRSHMSSKNGSSVAPKDDRPVSRLRPRPPITGLSSECIWDVANRMSQQRSDVALLVDANSNLAGIFTANDVVRRVVSKDLDVNHTEVAGVLTPDPRCVHIEDSALEALIIMVENHFQHLPVLDKEGSIVGILDIAKCLYDAISRMEKLEKRSDSAANEVAEQLATTLKHSKGTKKGMEELMFSLMDKAFGSKVPTVADILQQKSRRVFVSPGTSVYEASIKMAQLRSAILVVDNQKIIGILSAKDVLNRVVTPGLGPRSTLVDAVMTKNPDTYTQELTLVDAMHQMHDHRYLHLPIVDSAGDVLGIVDVMDVVEATMGNASGGSEGWASFFCASMDADVSDDSSIYSLSTAASKSHSKKKNIQNKSKRNARTVSKLRLIKPSTLPPETDLLKCCLVMSKKRTDVLLIKDHYSSHISGIFTDSDLTHRVIAQYINIEETTLEEVMTKSPKCVNASDSALEAIAVMIENRFRHLPVIDHDQNIIGVLDIAKCLYDAIGVLEKVQSCLESGDVSSHPLAQEIMGTFDSEDISSEQFQAMLAPLIQKLVPTVKDLLKEKKVASVRPTENIREAALKMAETKRAVLVVEDNELVGILTPNLILKRVITQKLPLDFTAVSSVMNEHPGSIDPSESLLETLHHMHSYKCYDLPVVDDDGRIHGLVSVLDIIESAMGGEKGVENWSSIIDSNFDFNDSNTEHSADDGSIKFESEAKLGRVPSLPIIVKNQDLPRIRVTTLGSSATDLSQDVQGFAIQDHIESVFVYKVTDGDGNMHRITASSENIDHLLKDVGAKFNADPTQITIKYTDMEGDEVTISCSRSLSDAVDHAKLAGIQSLKLKVVVSQPSTQKVETLSSDSSNQENSQSAGGNNKALLIGGSLIAVAAASAGAFFLMKRKSK